MPASIMTDDSLGQELALYHDDEFRELETFEDSAQDGSAQDEWDGIDDSEDEWDGIMDNLMQPPDEDVPYSSCEVLLQRAKSHAAEQGYAIVIKRSHKRKGEVVKYWYDATVAPSMAVKELTAFVNAMGIKYDLWTALFHVLHLTHLKAMSSELHMAIITIILFRQSLCLVCERRP